MRLVIHPECHADEEEEEGSARPTPSHLEEDSEPREGAGHQDKRQRTASHGLTNTGEFIPVRPAIVLSDASPLAQGGEENGCKLLPAFDRVKKSSVQWTTERFLATQVEAGDGRGHAGQIKSLQLENFMCHEHLVVDFK